MMPASPDEGQHLHNTLRCLTKMLYGESKRHQRHEWMSGTIRIATSPDSEGRTCREDSRNRRYLMYGVGIPSQSAKVAERIISYGLDSWRLRTPLSTDPTLHTIPKAAAIVDDPFSSRFSCAVEMNIHVVMAHQDNLADHSTFIQEISSVMHSRHETSLRSGSKRSWKYPAVRCIFSYQLNVARPRIGASGKVGIV